MRHAQPPRTPKPRRFDAKALTNVAARWRAGSELLATQPWSREAFGFYDSMLGICPQDLNLLERVIIKREALSDAADAIGIARQDEEKRLRAALTALAAGYEAADIPRPGEGSRCRCAHCGGLLPTTNAA